MDDFVPQPPTLSFTFSYRQGKSYRRAVELLGLAMTELQTFSIDPASHDQNAIMLSYSHQIHQLQLLMAASGPGGRTQALEDPEPEDPDTVMLSLHPGESRVRRMIFLHVDSHGQRSCYPFHPLLLKNGFSKRAIDEAAKESLYDLTMPCTWRDLGQQLTLYAPTGRMDTNFFQSVARDMIQRGAIQELPPNTSVTLEYVEGEGMVPQEDPKREDL